MFRSKYNGNEDSDDDEMWSSNSDDKHDLSALQAWILGPTKYYDPEESSGEEYFPSDSEDDPIEPEIASRIGSLSGNSQEFSQISYLEPRIESLSIRYDSKPPISPTTTPPDRRA